MVKREEPTLLQIGPWLEALRIPRSRVIEEAEITETYLSMLISGKRRNPSQLVLRRIADTLGIPLPMLYETPPDRDTLDKAREIERRRTGKSK